jgi:hypothetical protein
MQTYCLHSGGSRRIQLLRLEDSSRQPGLRNDRNKSCDRQLFVIGHSDAAAPALDLSFEPYVTAGPSDHLKPVLPEQAQDFTA